MAEVFDFGLQQHKIKMDGKFFENNLFAVAGDTGRRLEVQLLDSNNMVQNTTGISLRLNANVAGQATYADAILKDATTGKYELDLPSGMLLAPGTWQFQWQITDVAGKVLNSFAFMGTIGSNLSEGANEATNFYLNVQDLIDMQEDFLNGTIDSAALQTNIADKLNDLETTYAPDLTLLKAETSKHERLVKGSRSILDWEHLVLNKGLTTEDWKDALQAARDFLNTSILVNRLVFPSGIYQYSLSPNWNISDSIIEPDGEVRLRYTGVGNAVILDGGVETGMAWNVTFGKFFIEAPSTAMNGLFVRAIQSSEIKAKILGAGTNYAGLRVEWCVCTDFHITCSVNHETWYKGAKPKYGIYIDKRELQGAGLGGYTSWCSFYSPRIEGTQIGIHIERGQGNSFYSGTSEACSQTGIVLSASALYNKFFGIDMEANTNYDIYCMGKENEFYSVDSTGAHLFDGTAHDNVMIGGSHNIITLGASTYGNILQNVKYNRFNNGSVINDMSGKNRLMSNRNVGLNRTENRPPASSAITVGTSPFIYTNESGNDEMIHILGGTVSLVQYVHAGYGDSSGVNPQFIRLCPGDYVKVTYSVAPTMRKYTT